MTPAAKPAAEIKVNGFEVRLNKRWVRFLGGLMITAFGFIGHLYKQVNDLKLELATVQGQVDGCNKVLHEHGLVASLDERKNQ